jgi:hypothetical protein
MADLATLQARLAEAELAYHKLLTGAMEIEVEINGIRTQYFNSVTSMDRLQSYIAQLKAEIAAAGGTGALPRKAISLEL